jgi:hypothetical protein
MSKHAIRSVCVTDASLLYTFLSFARGQATTARHGPPTIYDVAAVCTFIDLLVLYDRVLILRGTPSSYYFFDEMFDDDWDAEFGAFLRDVRSLVVVQPLLGQGYQWNDALFFRLADDNFVAAVRDLPLDGWLGAPYRHATVVEEEHGVRITQDGLRGERTYRAPAGAIGVRRLDPDTLLRFMFLLGGTISGRYAAVHGLDHVPHPVRADDALTCAVNIAYPVIQLNGWPRDIYQKFVRAMSDAIFEAATASPIDRRSLGDSPLFYLYFLNRAKGDVRLLWRELRSFRQSEIGTRFRGWWHTLRDLARRADIVALSRESHVMEREANDLRKEMGLDVVTSELIGIANLAKPMFLSKAFEPMARRFPISNSLFRVLDASPRYLVTRDVMTMIRNNSALFVYPTAYF